MRNTDRAPYEIGNGEYLKEFLAVQAQFVASAEVIPDAIVAPEHHGGNQAKHFLGLRVQGTGLISLMVEAPEPSDDRVVLRQQPLIHGGPVCVEFVYHVHIIKSW